MGADNSIAQPVIFFDGVCNLCNASVLFIIKRDKQDRFKFASLQSEYAKETLPSEFTNGSMLPSLILFSDGIKTKSTAALSIARHLSGAWPLMYGFIIIPPFIRHFIYDLVAKNRYLLFGKKDECMIPTPELKNRFID